MSNTSSEMTKAQARTLALRAQSEWHDGFVTIVPWTEQYWTLQVGHDGEWLWVHSPQMWERTKAHFRREREH